MRPWRIVRTRFGSIPVPDWEVECPFCGEIMILHDFRVDHQVRYKFRHLDVHLKCPHCGCWVTFGVPISEEEYVELRNSPLHNVIIKDEEVLEEIKRLYSTNADVAKRLREWGYW